MNPTTKLVLISTILVVVLAGMASAAFNDSISFLWQMDASNAELIRSTSTVLNSGSGYGGYSNITGKVGSGAYSMVSGSSVKTSTFQPVMNTSRSNFTLAFWFRFNATSDFNANKGIIGTDLCPAFAVRVVEKQKTAGTSSGMQIGFWDSGCAWLAPSLTGNFTPETWYWIVVSYNSLPNGSSQKLYRDGSLINETSYTGALLVVNNTLNWGSLTSSSANFKLDQLTIMNRSVTDAEVTSWWNASNGCQNPGLCVDGVPQPIIPYANFTNITSEIPQINFSMPNSSTFTIIDDTPTFWVTALDETGTLSNCIASTTNTTFDGMLNYTYVKGTVISNRCGFSWNQSLGYGTTTTFYIGLNSSSGISTTAINSTNNYFTVYTQLPSPPNVTFVTSDPTDITSTNLFGGKYNATWSVNDSRFAINLSSVVLYHQVNNTLITDASATCRIIINGTPQCGYNTLGVTIYNTTTDGKNVKINTIVDENEILPATYVLEDEVTDDTQHSPKTFDQNTIYSTTILNVSNNLTYGYYEIMINKTATGGSDAQVWYCNSSYTTGTLTTDTNCFNFGTILATTTYNHTHTDYSAHQVVTFAVNTTSGRIGTVGITPTSYFILRSTVGAGTWQSWAVPNISRTDTTRNSNNTGTSWSNAAFTIDSHLHQFGPATYYQEYLCASNNKTSNNCSLVQNDALNLSGIPPTSPSLIYPAFNQTLEAAVTTNITWNPSISPQGYNITYNVSIYNDSSIMVQEVVTSTTQNTISWNPSNLGQMRIVVVAKDTNGLTSIGERTVQVVDTTPPVDYLYIPLNNSKSTTNYNNITYLTNDTFSTLMTCNLFDNAVPLAIQTVANGTNKTYQSNLTDGEHLIEIVCNDESGNVGNLVSTNFTIDTLAPVFVSVNTPNNTITLDSAHESFNVFANWTDANTISPHVIITTPTAGVNDYSTPTTLIPWSIPGIWKLQYYATDSFNNTATTGEYLLTVYTGVNVTLNAPANNSAQANSTVTFNWTTTSTYPATTNCTLTVDGIVNGTFPSNNNESIVQINFTDGSHRWNVTCTNGYTNTTSPTNEVLTNINGVVLQVYNGMTSTILRTWSAIVDGVTYNTTLFGTSISLPLTYYKGINLTNVTFFPSCTRGMVTDTDPTCGFFNTTTPILYTATYTNTTVNQTLITIIAMNSVTSQQINDRTFTYTSGTLTGTFIGNKTFSLNPTTPYNFTITTPNVTTKYSAFTPTLYETSSKYVYYTFTTDASYAIDNCSVFTTQAMNFTVRDTNTTIPINGSTLAAYARVWVDTEVGYRQYNLTWPSGTSFAICINSSYVLSTYAQMEYSAPGYTTRTYYLTNNTLTNTTNYVNLYLDSAATNVLITVIDQNAQPIKDAYIYVLAYDFPTNSFTTDSIIKTGTDGTAIANVQLLTQWYKLMGTKSGYVTKTLDPFVFTTTTKLFTMELEVAQPIEIEAPASISCSMTYDNSTRLFTLAYLDSTGNSNTACIKVYKQNLMTNTLVNETCQTSSGVDIVAGIPPSTGTGSWLAQSVIQDGGFEYQCGYPITYTDNDDKLVYGNTGLVATFLLVLGLSLVGIWSLPTAALFAVVGLMASWFLGIYTITLTTGIFLIIVAFITIYKVQLK